MCAFPSDHVLPCCGCAAVCATQGSAVAHQGCCRVSRRGRDGQLSAAASECGHCGVWLQVAEAPLQS